ncbi:hypothetical protein [Streptomyces sp. SID2563]|uniref:hypothetical protein n=1 Tax=Streptomyces sp. SID2563 TaxID=2690255 RepID=UPI0031FF15EE
MPESGLPPASATRSPFGGASVTASVMRSALGLHSALRQAEEPRVALVSSGAQLLAGADFEGLQFERRPYDPFTACAQSKPADALLAAGTGRRWAERGITANACAPGFIHTRLQRHLDDTTTARPPSRGCRPRFCWPPPRCWRA